MCDGFWLWTDLGLDFGSAIYNFVTLGSLFHLLGLSFVVNKIPTS